MKDALMALYKGKYHTLMDKLSNSTDSNFMHCLNILRPMLLIDLRNVEVIQFGLKSCTGELAIRAIGAEVRYFCGVTFIVNVFCIMFTTRYFIYEMDFASIPHLDYSVPTACENGRRVEWVPHTVDGRSVVMRLELL